MVIMGNAWVCFMVVMVFWTSEFSSSDHLFPSSSFALSEDVSLTEEITAQQSTTRILSFSIGTAYDLSQRQLFTQVTI
ncbi:hypothetical protein CEXT_787801 [Caerostris extrusa]|uniref:Uncharacterized protein n=1 Tax=Caerostris extrusa TaxID=172846 RepID=A0AAV4YCA8_CAEEX|nr:hypothetical protein CEXT_787801 [Caerostris extrusa]